MAGNSQNDPTVHFSHEISRFNGELRNFLRKLLCACNCFTNHTIYINLQSSKNCALALHAVVFSCSRWFCILRKLFFWAVSMYLALFWALLQFNLNTLRPRQNGRHFPDDICIFLNENVWISNKISLKFVPKGPINNIPTLVQIMAWRWIGDKPLSKPMVVRLPAPICVTRPQWVKVSRQIFFLKPYSNI